MGRKKLIRFAENHKNPRIIQPQHPFYENKDRRWTDFFPQPKPLVLELGCGRGEYSVGLAQHFQSYNYIGIDIKGNRLWYGAKLAETLGLDNVAFLRIMIQNIGDFFQAKSVSQVWIPFPDPRPKTKDRHRRLTQSRFLKLYRQILKDDGCLHFKTDDLKLFDFTLQEVKKFGVTDLEYTYDYYQSALQVPNLPLTKYEQMFLQKHKTIKYLKLVF